MISYQQYLWQILTLYENLFPDHSGYIKLKREARREGKTPEGERKANGERIGGRNG